MWYWHTPFQLTEADRKGLRDIGVTTLYVRAGTFATDGQKTSLILPETWKSRADGLRVVLVYNCHPGLVSHFEEMPISRMAAETAEGIRRSWAKAVAAGLNPSGVQMDIDCPTRLLPIYTNLLKGIRAGLTKELANGNTFSITALPTWLSSKNIDPLASTVDFIAPQFYEGRTGKSADTVFPVSDPEGLQAGLRRLGRLQIPCYAGIATYGHALLYDDQKNLVGMYRGLSAEDALRHPSFEPLGSEPLDKQGRPTQNVESAIGEDRLILKAMRPDSQGQGLGFRIAYLLPTPLMVRRQMDAFRAARPANVRGVILYRFPEPGESMTLPLSAIARGMRGEPTPVAAKCFLRSQAIPWELIDSGKTADRAPRELTVHLESTGSAPTLPARNSIQLLVALNKPGINGVAPGDFDEAIPGTLDETGRFVKCAPAHADAVRFARYHMLPGDVLRSGPILVPADGATRADARWVAQGPGGFQKFEGETSLILGEEKR